MKRLACLLLLAPACAGAVCPPMSAYSVTGVSADALPVNEAVDLLFAGTAWKLEALGPVASVHVTYRGVSGPLDKVLAKVIQQAGRAAGAPVSAVSDPTRCTVTLSVKAPAPAAPPISESRAAATSAHPVRLDFAPVVPHPASWTAKAGGTVRGTLEEWAKHAGWTVVWPMDDLDYRIVAPLQFDGTISEAAAQLTRLYTSAARPFRVAIHPSQKVMVFAEWSSNRQLPGLSGQTLGAIR